MRRRVRRVAKSRSLRSRILFCVGLLCVSAFLAAVYVALDVDLEQPPVVRQAPSPQVQSPHPVYPYSVVPGGVRDAAALKAAILQDPVVAQHYQGFDVDSAFPTTMREEKLAYVSYRVGNRIFWTARQVRLARDEQVLSDGSLLIRVRCGNRISFERQPGVRPVQEPAEVEMDLLPQTFSDLTLILPWKEEEAILPISEPGDLPTSPPTFLPTSLLKPFPDTIAIPFEPFRTVPVVIPLPPPTTVKTEGSPEPGTCLTLGLGLVALLLLRARGFPKSTVTPTSLNPVNTLAHPPPTRLLPSDR